MALGGSTNSALHLRAIAYYAEVDVTLADFGQFDGQDPAPDLARPGRATRRGFLPRRGIPRRHGRAARAD